MEDVKVEFKVKKIENEALETSLAERSMLLMKTPSLVARSFQSLPSPDDPYRPDAKVTLSVDLLAHEDEETKVCFRLCIFIFLRISLLAACVFRFVDSSSQMASFLYLGFCCTILEIASSGTLAFTFSRVFGEMGLMSLDISSGFLLLIRGHQHQILCNLWIRFSV